MRRDAMRGSVEVEWQFVVRDADAFERWIRAARFDGWTLVPAPTRRLRDVYLDTADWRIARAGFALRVRRSATGAEATLKALAPARHGPARRRELTTPIGTATPAALRTAPGSVGVRVRRLAGARPLRRLFAVATRRRVLLLGAAGGVRAELALDRTRIAAGRRCVRLERVEIEVVRGSAAPVARFVAALRRRRRLAPAGASKFAAGLALAGLAIPRRS
jgi:inorganic triphosphatase YgiF